MKLERQPELCLGSHIHIQSYALGSISESLTLQIKRQDPNRFAGTQISLILCVVKPSSHDGEWTA